MENILNFVVDNALVLVPVIYVIGAILKGTEVIKDKYIPVILLPVGVLLAMFLLGFNVQAFIQGILVVGVSVYGNQLVKQIKKEE
ncbi:MAG: phage holin family protein [Bacilli bacterium]